MNENMPQEKLQEKGSLALVMLNIILFSIVILFVGVIGQTKNIHTPGIAGAAASQTLLDKSAFDKLNLEGSSAIVWDATTHNIIFEKDANTPRPLASLTKIMTAVTARALLPENTTITIKKEYIATEGDSGLLPGEQWSLKNLLDFSLVVSSNDGAHAIAEAAIVFEGHDFTEYMNSLAQHLELSTLHFTNETGLDNGTRYGGIGSAKDMVRLMEYAIKKYPHIFEATSKPSMIIKSLSIPHTAINTDKALDNIPNVVASKTGYTSAAGGNLIVAFDAGINRPIIIAVLHSTQDGRFSDMEKLASSTLAFIKANP